MGKLNRTEDGEQDELHLHDSQPAVYPSTTEVHYVAALKKADLDALVVRLEKDIDPLQDRLDQFNHVRKVEVDGRVLDLAS